MLRSVHRGVYCGSDTWRRPHRAQSGPGCWPLGSRCGRRSAGPRRRYGTCGRTTCPRRRRSATTGAASKSDPRARSDLRPTPTTRVDGIPVDQPRAHVTRARRGAAGAPRDRAALEPSRTKLDLLDARAIDDVRARSNGHRGTAALAAAIRGLRPATTRRPAPISSATHSALLDELALRAAARQRDAAARTNSTSTGRSSVSWSSSTAGSITGRGRAFEEDRARDRWCAVRDIERLRIDVASARTPAPRRDVAQRARPAVDVRAA